MKKYINLKIYIFMNVLKVFFFAVLCKNSKWCKKSEQLFKATWSYFVVFRNSAILVVIDGLY